MARKGFSTGTEEETHTSAPKVNTHQHHDAQEPIQEQLPQPGTTAPSVI